MPSSKTAARRHRMPAPGPWLVYILRCRDGSLYTGITTDLAKRLRAHAAGKASRYTRSRLPVRPVYGEPQATKSLALKREAAIKALSRPQKLRLVAGPADVAANVH
jgi:putative endonuclease